MGRSASIPQLDCSTSVQSTELTERKYEQPTNKKPRISRNKSSYAGLSHTLQHAHEGHHSCSLEDLEFPGVLVLVVQAVHCGEAQFPGLLVLVVQAVHRGEAQG